MNKKNIILNLIIVVILHVLVIASANFQKEDPLLELNEKTYINVARITTESLLDVEKKSIDKKSPEINETRENKTPVDKKKN